MDFRTSDAGSILFQMEEYFVAVTKVVTVEPNDRISSQKLEWMR
jgi:hypothetical protein